MAASRNDDHGGDPLIRTQLFISSFARQCERHRLPAEVIIVDWNPVADRPGLAAVLHLPPDTALCTARVITVPGVLHDRLKYADKIPFFQMIAKNAGIRRAKGQFVLATNIDILFSDELVRFIALQRLDPTKQYRVDRYDIKNGLAGGASLDEVLDYAWNNPIRANRRLFPRRLVRQLYGEALFKKVCVPDPELSTNTSGVSVVQEDGVWQIRPDRHVDMHLLHTNACGDFTLLSREGWHAIRGYPEFEAFSFNIDSMGLLAAHYAGYEEVSLLPPCVCFHIEHGLGSGWTPEGEKKLFTRLRDAGVLNPEWPVLAPLVDEMRAKSKNLEFNHAGWGLSDIELPEQMMGDTSTIPADKLAKMSMQAQTHRISAIEPGFDLDRLALANEHNPGHVIALYLPDSVGNYSEENAVARIHRLRETIAVDFQLEAYASQFPLRLDPCHQSGLVSISSISVFDMHNRTILALNASDAGKVGVGGTAVKPPTAPFWTGRWLRRLLQSSETDGQQFIDVLSTGEDPQIYLPSLQENIAFPVTLRIQMRFVPGTVFPI